MTWIFFVQSLSKQNSRSSRHSTDNDDISSMAEEEAGKETIASISVLLSTF